MRLLKPARVSVQWHARTDLQVVPMSVATVFPSIYNPSNTIAIQSSEIHRDNRCKRAKPKEMTSHPTEASAPMIEQTELQTKNINMIRNIQAPFPNSFQ